MCMKKTFQTEANFMRNRGCGYVARLKLKEIENVRLGIYVVVKIQFLF